jgi:glutaredoxin 3
MTKVKIYTTNTCPWCKKAKEFMKEKKISFIEKDVTKNEKNRNEMIKISGQMGVPVLDINGTIIVGFNSKEIEKAIKKK